MHPWSQYCLVPSRGMQEDGRGGKEVEKEERERKVGVGRPQQLENGLHGHCFCVLEYTQKILRGKCTVSRI